MSETNLAEYFFPPYHPAGMKKFSNPKNAENPNLAKYALFIIFYLY